MQLQLFDMSNTDQKVLKIALLAGLLGWLEPKQIYLVAVVSLLMTFGQIIIEGIFLARYGNDGSEQWLTGCDVLSSCSTDQGPASAVSQIYNEVNSLVTIVWVEIAANVVNLVMMCATVFMENQVSSSSTQRSKLHLFILGLEVFLEIAQVAGSGIALKSLEATISPVNQLTSSLIGKFSESAALCLLPCCADSSCVRSS